ncbi:MAG: EAL domain-containing protein [Marinobacter sp.]|uniref:sensor domain-containing diguanylate cyclase n=1 Tax=Marinobacter sp. TaxID=50741 RepID=UPI0032973D9A
MGTMNNEAMTSPHFHPHEARRMETLRSTGLLDTDPDPRLDQITKLLTDTFDVPMALFTLVDENRQWFKSRVGFEVCETLRQHSFCAHAIQQDDVFEVRDASIDERFSNNPLVTSEPFIRFYAGAQVYGRNRLPLGTLCVLDTVPRTITEKEKKLLAGMADLVTTLIDPSISPLAGSNATTNAEVLSPEAFVSKVEQSLHKEDRSQLGLGIVQLHGLKRLRKTRGFEFCERACDETVKALYKLAPGALAVTRISFNQYCIVARQYASIAHTSLNTDKLEQALHRPLTVDDIDVDIQAHMLWAQPLSGFSSSKQILSLIAELSSSCTQLPTHRRLAIYGDELLEEIHQQDVIRSDLSSALSNRDIFFEYQPKVDAVSREIFGFEALMRWHHPTLGPVAPPKIVEASIDIGIEQTLLGYTLATVLSQLADWKRQNLLNGMNVAINVTAAELCSPLFPTTLARLLEEHGVPGNCLELELLEDGIVGNLERCLTNINQSKKLGVQFAIDDFGTGFSSLSYLHRIPADTLKIDKTFVERIEDDQTSTALVNSIVTLGRITGMKTVAEGIENQAQAIMMKAFQCDYLQGYYFDRPLSAARATQLMKNNKKYPL